jgi:hypothetical protein
LNATFEFARMAIALRSPLELPALMNACARRQFELWIEQTRAFSNLAEKIGHVAAATIQQRGRLIAGTWLAR